MFKSVATRIPDSTRLADPSRSPVYSDIFNYHLKTFCLVVLNFYFQKRRDPNPRLDPVGGSKPDPGLLRCFHLSYQNILLCLFVVEAVSALGKPIIIYKFGNLTCIYHQTMPIILTNTHAIQFRMLSFYRSFIISQHAFSMK